MKGSLVHAMEAALVLIEQVERSVFGPRERVAFAREAITRLDNRIG
jgi:hypothetical protein